MLRYGWLTRSLAIVGVAGVMASRTPASTNVSGVITTPTVWTTNASPYIVTAALTVNATGALTIEPGVVVQIAVSVTLTALGPLHAEGTEQAPVVFTRRPQDAYGGGINIVGTGPGALTTGRFSRCAFSYLTHTTAMLRGQYARLSVADCTFTKIPTTVIRPVDSRADIRRCHIFNTHEGINLVRCAGVVSSNRIENLPGEWDAVDLDAYWVGGGDDSLSVTDNHLSLGNDDAIDVNFAPALIAGNIISNFTDKGVSLGLGGDAPTNLAYGARATIVNNLILRCDMGIAPKDGSTPLVFNNTIVGCNYGICAYQKVSGGGGHPVATNTIVWGCGVGVELLNGSTLTAGHCIIQGTSPWPGPGNSNLDPAFANPALHDYRLLPGSPALDAGVIMPWMAGARDLDGNPRVSGPAPDLGAFEAPPTPLACNFSATTEREGPAPLAVAFTAVLSGTQTGDVSFAWDFDADGTNDAAGAGLRTVTGLYARVGLYSVALRVTNAGGDSATAVKPAYVNVRAAPGELFVSPGGAHRAPYASWPDAATNIAAALAAAATGVTVTVAEGDYRLAATLAVTNAVRLRAAGRREFTRVLGNAAVRCVNVNHPAARVEGFTLAGGRADYGGAAWCAAGTLAQCVATGSTATVEGGGIYLLGTGVATGCVVVGNTASGAGGGAYLAGGGVLRDSEVRNNRTTVRDGAGVMATGAALVERCRVWNNRSGDDGGGIQSGDINGVPGAVVRACTVWSNTAPDKGGGLMLWPGAVADNCVVYSNLANEGGGVYFRGGGLLRHASIAGNTATLRGGGVCSEGGATAYNCVSLLNMAPGGSNWYSAGSANVYSHCLTHPALAGTGNTTGDPRFTAPPSDLRPAADSAALDAGTNLAAVAADITGAPRPLDGNADGTARTDIGAHEFLSIAADTDGDVMPDAWEWEHGLLPATPDAGADADADGFINGDEWIAGMDPRSSTSRLEIVSIETAGAGVGPVLAWPGAAGRVYTVDTAPGWPQAGWTRLYSVTGSVSGPMTWTNRSAGATAGVFRVRAAIFP